ncbi:MAG: hypothetical protein HRF40_10995 [Nitrososphaera sp.]
MSGDFDIAAAAKMLSIGRVGVPFNNKINKGIIYRLSKKPQQPSRYPYLIVSDTTGELADLVTINDFSKYKEKLKKVKKGTGIEITISSARKMDAAGVGRWFEDVAKIHSYCYSSGCQLILSSGARSMNEMVSGPCLDAILRKCDISPERYWREMNEWIESKLSKRVYLPDA